MFFGRRGHFANLQKLSLIPEENDAHFCSLCDLAHIHDFLGFLVFPGTSQRGSAFFGVAIKKKAHISKTYSRGHRGASTIPIHNVVE